MRGPAIIIGVIVLAAVLFVAVSLRQPNLEAYPPSPALAQEAGDSLVGPVVYTIDASAPSQWRYFDFSRGSVVPADDPLGWDLAFNRFHIISNGGAGFAGRAGIIDMGTVPFDSVTSAPADGYTLTAAKRDSTNAAIVRWYEYSWTSHILKPKKNVWVVRTADGRYARLRLLSYYCMGAKPGCVTFEYVYQGAGTRELAK